MEKEVIAALIAAFTSLALAVFSLLTARSARARALAAEEEAKQTEVVRTKALNAVEEITFSLGKLLEVVRTMQIMRSSFSSIEDFIQEFRVPLERFTDNFINAFYKNLVYLDEQLTSEFTSIRETLIHQPTSEDGLREQFEVLRQYLEIVTHLARHRYLPSEARPNESMHTDVARKAARRL